VARKDKIKRTEIDRHRNHMPQIVHLSQSKQRHDYDLRESARVDGWSDHHRECSAVGVAAAAGPAAEAGVSYSLVPPPLRGAGLLPRGGGLRE